MKVLGQSSPDFEKIIHREERKPGSIAGRRVEFFFTGSVTKMQELTSILVVGGAIMASLAFGVLAAHLLCRTAFAVLRNHAASVANSRLEKASAA